jgi:hypothetical protein
MWRIFAFSTEVADNRYCIENKGLKLAPQVGFALFPWEEILSEGK